MGTLPTIDMVATGDNIARLRERAGMTVRDLQIVFGFATPQAIYKWQSGACMPTVDKSEGSAHPEHIANDILVNSARQNI